MRHSSALKRIAYEPEPLEPIIQPVEYYAQPTVPLSPKRQTQQRSPRLRAKQTVLTWQRWLNRLVWALLVIGTIQAVRGVVDSATTLITLTTQEAALTQLHQDALEKNQSLKTSLQRSQDPAGLEELVRNQLSMVGPDELLVRFF
ncbi:MAG: hypothetical protein SFZ03_07385 [Candidatus Melainabacteria bacterium]|nr:hypothetical protein [Candidatus Melainabacteria bacterium]